MPTVRRCCIIGCQSNSRQNPQLQFFQFPRPENPFHKLWKQACHASLSRILPFKKPVVCALHFTPNCIGGRRLTSSAVPSLRLEVPANLKDVEQQAMVEEIERSRRCAYINAVVYEWLVRANLNPQLRGSITHGMIKEKADTAKQLIGASNFVADNRWLNRFRETHLAGFAQKLSSNQLKPLGPSLWIPDIVQDLQHLFPPTNTDRMNFENVPEQYFDYMRQQYGEYEEDDDVKEVKPLHQQMQSSFHEQQNHYSMKNDGQFNHAGFDAYGQIQSHFAGYDNFYGYDRHHPGHSPFSGSSQQSSQHHHGAFTSPHHHQQSPHHQQMQQQYQQQQQQLNHSSPPHHPGQRLPWHSPHHPSQGQQSQSNHRASPYHRSPSRPSKRPRLENGDETIEDLTEGHDERNTNNRLNDHDSSSNSSHNSQNSNSNQSNKKRSAIERSSNEKSSNGNANMSARNGNNAEHDNDGDDDDNSRAASTNHTTNHERSNSNGSSNNDSSAPSPRSQHSSNNAITTNGKTTPVPITTPASSQPPTRPSSASKMNNNSNNSNSNGYTTPTILNGKNAQNNNAASKNNSNASKELMTYREALEHLKPLEEFALLKENFRLIGLLTQMEAVLRKSERVMKLDS